MCVWACNSFLNKFCKPPGRDCFSLAVKHAFDVSNTVRNKNIMRKLFEGLLKKNDIAIIRWFCIRNQDVFLLTTYSCDWTRPRSIGVFYCVTNLRPVKTENRYCILTARRPYQNSQWFFFLEPEKERGNWVLMQYANAPVFSRATVLPCLQKWHVTFSAELRFCRLNGWTKKSRKNLDSGLVRYTRIILCDVHYLET